MKKTPILRRHKASDRAYIWDGERRVYFGKWGSTIAAEAYRRYLLDLEKRGSIVASDAPVTVAEICELYLSSRSNGYYKSPQINVDRSAIAYLVELNASTPARDFGPLALRRVRDAMEKSGRLNRRSINAYISTVRRVFKFAVSNELVDANVLTALGAVEPLSKGRSKAREPSAVRPIDPLVVEKTIEAAPPTIAAIITILRFTGMRPSEALRMRRRDISRDDESGLLVYTLETDKTSYRRADDSKRQVFLGARCEKVLSSVLVDETIEPDDYLFTRRAIFCENDFLGYRRGRRDASTLDEPLGAARLRDYVLAACRRAGVPSWHPYQLRHLFATEIRRSYGLEAAQIMLGHSRADVTQIYAERDSRRAVEIARRES